MINNHLPHLEDLLFTEGVAGAASALLLCKKLVDQIVEGNMRHPDVQVSIKFDGAPSFFMGVDPADEKFFVCTKSLLNVKKPPIVFKNLSDFDVTIVGYSRELLEKLKAVFRSFRSSTFCNPAAIIQGDYLFDNSGGKRRFFRANIIAYEPKFDLSKYDCGVCLHTVYTYSGASLRNNLAVLPLKPGVSAPPNVLQVQAHTSTDHYWDCPEDEGNTMIDAINSLMHSVNDLSKMKIFNLTEVWPALSVMLELYQNVMIRDGIQVSPHTASNFLEWWGNKIVADVSFLHSDVAKTSYVKRWKPPLDVLKGSSDAFLELRKLLTAYYLLRGLKEQIISCLRKIHTTPTISTWVTSTKTGDDEPTEHEGFVVKTTDDLMVKLVSRRNFSYFNSSNLYVRGFEK